MTFFKGKVAVITGAASGIGEAIAKECLKRKMKLVLCDIDKDKLAILKKQLEEEGGNSFKALVVDVSNKKNVEKIADTSFKVYHRVDFLFNNAGIPGPIGSIWEVEEKELERVIQVNLMSVIYGLHAFIPRMIGQDTESWIINTASGAGLYTSGSTAIHLPGYLATKHAVVALSEQLYIDLQARNSKINVSVLCPGLVATNFLESIKEDASDRLPEFKERIAKGMSPHDVAVQVFEALQNRKFYILTHYDEHRERIKKRTDNILLGKNPGDE